MNNCIDLVFGDRVLYQGPITNIADDEFGSGRNGRFKPSGKVVQDDNGLPCVNQLEDRVTTDVAGTTGDQNWHSFLSIAC